MKNLRRIAAAGALIALVQTQALQAQELVRCVAADDVADTVTYLVPEIVDVLRGKCATELPADSFLLGRSDEWVAGFSALKEQTWPGARRFFLVFDDSPDDDGLDLAELPDELLKPLVGIAIAAVATQELKIAAGDCTKIDEAFELISPLPPQNTGGLIGLAVEFADVDNPPICKNEAFETNP